MGAEQELTLIEILNINQATNLVEKNTNLKPTVGYRLGILGSYVSRASKAFENEQSKRITKFNEDRKKIIGTLKEDELDQDAIKQLNELGVTLTNQIQELKNQKERIKVPEFKLDDFVASEDIKNIITTKDNNSEIVIIKKGSLLVPTGFFKLMGEIIKEN